MTMTATQLAPGKWRVSEEDGPARIVYPSTDTEAGAIAAVTEAAAGPTTQDIEAQRVAQIKAACRARIYAVVDPTAQINTASNMAAGLLSPADETTYAAALGWVTDMRAACADMIADDAIDPYDDANWPDVPAGVAELAAQY